jgi:hypothetical protein
LVQLLLLVAVFVAPGPAGAVQLDIHLKLDYTTNDLVVKLGREITRLAPHNQVDFDTLAEPHVTLYLADVVHAQLSFTKLAVAALCAPSEPSTALPLHHFRRCFFLDQQNGTELDQAVALFEAHGITPVLWQGNYSTYTKETFKNNLYAQRVPPKRVDH